MVRRIITKRALVSTISRFAYLPCSKGSGEFLFPCCIAKLQGATVFSEFNLYSSNLKKIQTTICIKKQAVAFQLSGENKVNWLSALPINKIIPLQKIDWRKEFYLEGTLKKLESPREAHIKPQVHKRIRIEGNALSKLFMYIAMIAERANEDGTKINIVEETYHSLDSNIKKLTDEEIKELDKGPSYISLLCLDISTLIIFVRIFMDKLARLSSLLISAKGVKAKNFNSFKRSLSKLKRKEIEAFARLIEENTMWLGALRNLRDDFVVHHPGAGGALVFFDSEAHVTLTTSKKITEEPKRILLDSEAKDISMEEINNWLSNLKRLLFNLNAFLTENLEKLPFESA
jgi:hypothetical protein